jgi:hypothetical protein
MLLKITRRTELTQDIFYLLSEMTKSLTDSWLILLLLMVVSSLTLTHNSSQLERKVKVLKLAKMFD